MIVEFILLENGKLPEKQTENSVGYDLFSTVETEILPNQVKLIDLGFKMKIENGYEAQIRSRSGLALKNSIFVLNSPGTIDPDYRDVVGVILMNLGSEKFLITKHQRIAQMIFNKIIEPKLVIVQNLDQTNRKGGFGSTEMKGL